MTRDTGSYGFSSTSPNVDQAFIQFGGLTAGRSISFFDNGDLPTEHFGTLRFSDAPNLNLFAYTFSFGNGFSASIALEEGRYAGTEFDGAPCSPKPVSACLTWSPTCSTPAPGDPPFSPAPCTSSAAPLSPA